jgi:hypothetical protein
MSGVWGALSRHKDNPMRARYVGAEPSTTTFGKTFHQFKWAKADDLSDEAKAALAANPTFETDGAPMDAAEP